MKGWWYAPAALVIGIIVGNILKDGHPVVAAAAFLGGLGLLVASSLAGKGWKG